MTGRLTLAAAISIGIASGPQVRAQTPPAAATAPKEFEVASVKPSAPGTHISFVVSPGGRFTATAMTLRRLIMFAYNVGPRQLNGGESWIDSARYDVVAKPPDGAFPNLNPKQAEVIAPSGRSVASWTALDRNAQSTVELREMVQSLLADRFQLKVHSENKDLPAYALIVGKNGPKIEESKSQGGPQMKIAMGQITFQNAPMLFLSVVLTQLSGRVVLDRTGLKGSYDFSVQWNPQDMPMAGMRGAAAMQAGSNPPAAAEPSGPSVFTAVQEMGLKLEATKGPVPVWVIDHAEKPSEN